MMAHQTPQYPAGKNPEHLCDNVMIEFPLCGLFSGSKKNESHKKCDEALDAINFSPTTAGPRKQKSMESMQSIVDRLYTVLNSLSLLAKFRYEVEDMRENSPGLDSSDAERDNRRLQDAVNLSVLVITYWEEEWASENPRADREEPIMEEAKQLMGDLMEGIQDNVTETWDSVCKVSLQKSRLWLQMGGLDKSAPYRESYVTEVANDDGANDTKSCKRLGGQRNRFQCNQCPAAFDIAVNLEDHLRQNHDGRGVGKRFGRTLKQRVFGSLVRSVGLKGKVGNNQQEEDSGTDTKEAESISSAPLAESWLDVAPVLDPLLQLVQCPTCSKTYNTLSALHNHRQAEHSEGKDDKGMLDPKALDPAALAQGERRPEENA